MKYATLFVSLLIIIAVLIPGGNLPDVNIGGYDKLIHFAMFLVWALALRYDFEAKRPSKNLIFLVAGISFSVFTEVIQILIEGRSFDVYDMAADVVGLIVGLLIARPVIRWIRAGLKGWKG